MKGQIQLSVGIIIVIVLAVIGMLFVTTYNEIVSSSKLTEEAAAQIEVVCQRRLDLVPNLVETVKGYAAHERGTLEAVIAARNQAQGILDQIKNKSSLSKEDIMALSSTQGQVNQGIRSLFALIENYPDLKASSNFMALQDQLEGTENRISVARQRYNQAARIFNTQIEVFPGVIVAPMFGFEEKAYWEAQKEAMEGIKVKF